MGKARPPSPATVPAFELLSPETGTTYFIFVEAPATPGPVQVMIFLDGDDQFRFASGAHRELVAAGQIAPLLLVGVGYGASYRAPGNRRGRDYTPTAMPGETDTGGADAFLRFLTATLWTELKRRYVVDESLRGLGGHSLGSLLALHALFQPAPFFQRFLVSSPSIWFDDRSLLRLAARHRDAQDTLPARVFLSLGEEDSPSMSGDLDLLEEQLRHRPYQFLDMVRARYPGRDHYNVVPLAFREGLKALFGHEQRQP
ncbi:MAG: alpha/beta hydrolase [Opitutaceae bacterium]|nr:alpha/beta hydrolase [Opitutaceae bacterium]